MRIFLVIPFTSEFNDISQLVRQAVMEGNHQLVRMDEVMSTGTIVDQIHDEIKKADLVIADVSDRNPNVMYELGGICTIA